MAAILDENPQIGIVGANVREVEADLSPITWGPEITITYDLYDPREVQGLSNCVSPMAMYRKSVWETVGGYNEDLMDCAEDWDFWLRCIDHNQTYQKVEQVLYTCRHREGSRSAAIYNRSKDRLRTETNQVLALHNLPLR
jgi:GT2 family glycosyltransferase